MGMCRGFAFVDFLSKQEARSAADAVSGTHLYGRRLVRQSSFHLYICDQKMLQLCSHTKLLGILNPAELHDSSNIMPVSRGGVSTS